MSITASPPRPIPSIPSPIIKPAWPACTCAGPDAGVCWGCGAAVGVPRIAGIAAAWVQPRMSAAVKRRRRGTTATNTLRLVLLLLLLLLLGLLVVLLLKVLLLVLLVLLKVWRRPARQHLCHDTVQVCVRCLCICARFGAAEQGAGAVGWGGVRVSQEGERSRGANAFEVVGEEAKQPHSAVAVAA